MTPCFESTAAESPAVAISASGSALACSDPHLPKGPSTIVSDKARCEANLAVHHVGTDLQVPTPSLRHKLLNHRLNNLGSPVLRLTKAVFELVA